MPHPLHRHRARLRILSALVSAALVSACGGGGSPATVALLVSNFASDTVSRYDQDGKVLEPKFINANDNGAAGFNGIAVQGTTIFVSTQNANELRRYDVLTGRSVAVQDVGLKSPQAVREQPDGSVLVVSAEDDRLVRVPATGAPTTVVTLGGGKDAADHFGPIDTAVGPDGCRYVSGFDAAALVRLAGPNCSAATLRYTAASDASGRPIYLPLAGMARAPDGQLLVQAIADLETGSGLVLRLEGSQLRPFIRREGLSPGAMALGPDGALYLADLSRHAIDRYDASTGRLLGGFVADTAMNGLNTPLFMAFESH